MYIVLYEEDLIFLLILPTREPPVLVAKTGKQLRKQFDGINFDNLYEFMRVKLI